MTSSNVRTEFNVYCDESCHLQHDNSNVMVLGATWCPKAVKDEVFGRIREIKVKHGLSAGFEAKWNKISKGKEDFYLELINYFFDDDDLHFRAIVIPDKQALNHDAFNQDHDTFYYKMYFDLLKVILSPNCCYNIYIDIKDTRSQEKVTKLHEVLRNNQYDYQNQIIKKIQQVNSKEVELLQITDMITGAISYLHRGLSGNEAKLKIIEKIRFRSKYKLLKSTLVKEDKMNVFIWKHRLAGNG